MPRCLKSVDRPACTSASVACPLRFFSVMPPPMSSSRRQISLQRSAVGLAAAVHQLRPLCQPSMTPWLSIHMQSGGIANSSIFKRPHKRARRDVGNSSGQVPYSPRMISPSLLTNTAAHPALRAHAGGPPRTAPSVKPTPVKANSPGGGRPPHHRVTALGVAVAASLVGIP